MKTKIVFLYFVIRFLLPSVFWFFSYFSITLFSLSKRVRSIICLVICQKEALSKQEKNLMLHNLLFVFLLCFVSQSSNRNRYMWIHYLWNNMTRFLYWNSNFKLNKIRIVNSMKNTIHKNWIDNKTFHIVINFK